MDSTRLKARSLLLSAAVVVVTSALAAGQSSEDLEKAGDRWIGRREFGKAIG